MQYKVCPHCGSHLDFGEKCDCNKEGLPHANETSPTEKTSKDVHKHYSTSSPKNQVKTVKRRRKSRKYDTMAAILAQQEYCRQNGKVNYAPAFNGACLYCGRNIYVRFYRKDGQVTGYTVKQAATTHIVCCPHCKGSFID